LGEVQTTAREIKIKTVELKEAQGNVWLMGSSDLKPEVAGIWKRSVQS